jgi:isopentenyl diphosphate isomerase/L-lactate dehydrogenase-like FMN-dependent dehydrogenase
LRESGTISACLHKTGAISACLPIFGTIFSQNDRRRNCSSSANQTREFAVEPINLFDYEALAQTRMERVIWDYYQGGSEDEVTLRANRAAFERIRLRPRMLVDISTIDMQTSVLGISVSMPILVAPTANHALAHPDGELATVRAVSQAGTILTTSTFATFSIEETAAAVKESGGGLLWFQLYATRGPRTVEALVHRAEAAGYRAIVLTADTPHVGRKERDLHNGFVLSNYARLANFEGETVEEVPTENSPGRHIVATWETVDWLRSLTKLPIVLKGILTAEDAHLAVEHGVQAILVSNHGGRQLDGAIATIKALPEVVEAVAGRCEIYVDGGIRRGTDVLKALALGARAVLIGRPVLWGLAVNGQAGVRHVLELLRAELGLAMALAGRPTLASIDRSLVKLP